MLETQGVARQFRDFQHAEPSEPRSQPLVGATKLRMTQAGAVQVYFDIRLL